MKILSKDKRIKHEIERLESIYSDMDANAMGTIESLIRRAAYMRATLEDYEADLDSGGYVEMFSQSPNTPPYERERPVARLYNAMIKNYQTVIKQLTEALPKSAAEVNKELMDFLGAK